MLQRDISRRFIIIIIIIIIIPADYAITTTKYTQDVCFFVCFKTL